MGIKFKQFSELAAKQFKYFTIIFRSQFILIDIQGIDSIKNESNA